jgi:hypothetical protein
MLRIYVVAVGLIFASVSLGIERAAPSSTPALNILKTSTPASIDVTLTQASKGPTRIWKAGNSWGAANWPVLVLRTAELYLFREDPDQRFTMNVPRFEN